MGSLQQIFHKMLLVWFKHISCPWCIFWSSRDNYRWQPFFPDVKMKAHGFFYHVICLKFVLQVLHYLNMFAPIYLFPPFQGASVLSLWGQRLRRFSSAGRQRRPRWVWEACDDRSGPSEAAVQGRHVDVQGVRQEQIYVRHRQTGTRSLLAICKTRLWPWIQHEILEMTFVCS